MPDWTAPFKLPKLTSEEYRARKAAYVAKYGYSITIPGFEDIIHIPVEKPVTIEEQEHWRKKDYKWFSEERYHEIQYIKRRRKERFLSMLGSATPELFRNHASIMTAMDDTQDALATAAAVGIVAVKTLPRRIAGVLQGPIGWVMMGSEIFNTIMATQRGPMTALAGKRYIGEATELNPFTKKARLKRLKRMKRIMPTKGDVIQALQVTDNIFGWGVSLGQLMNLPIEIIAGNVRRFVWGQAVTVKYPIPDMAHWERTMRVLSRGIGMTWGMHWGTDDTYLTATLIGYNIVNQIDRAQSEWDPLDHIHDIGKIEIRAPAPENVITREIYAEEGLNPDDHRGWPGGVREWATLEDIASGGQPIAQDNLRNYCERNRSNFMGMIGSQNAVEGALVHLGNMEGEDAVEADYTAICKICYALQHAGYYFPQYEKVEQWEKLRRWIQVYDDNGNCPSLPDTLNYAKEQCGIEFKLTKPGVGWE